MGVVIGDDLIRVDRRHLGTKCTNNATGDDMKSNQGFDGSDQEIRRIS